MNLKVDNIKLDNENVEFNHAVEFVMNTNKSIYLTGKAGTGKTTFLKYIKQITNKKTIVLAPTGVAAINAGGITINSFFQIPFGPFVTNDSRLRTTANSTENKETIYSTFNFNNTKRKIIENLELLIIDEISMVRADTLDVIDKLLRIFRKKQHLPFGGVQMILIGDAFQLPPIANNEQWNILKQFYKTPYFFSSKAIEQNMLLFIELKKIYRQKDKSFIDLLNKVRVNNLDQEDFKILKSKYDPFFNSKNSSHIILATHNYIVNNTNLLKLKQLDSVQFTFEAKISGEFPNNSRPTDHILYLKVGAQIMFTKNDKHRRYFNGKIGKIKILKEDEIVVGFDDGSEVEVEIAVWKNIKYTYNKEKNRIEEEIIGAFTQYPIRLAWAITVHKSQGLTFEKVIADLGKAFAPGQVYVALSRCISLDGLILNTPLLQNSIKTDLNVLEFAKKETPDTLILDEMNEGRADFYYKKARENFEKGDFEKAFDYFKKAMTFRNDIETDQLRKYFLIHTKKLFLFEDRSMKLLEELDRKSDLISAQNETIKTLKEKILSQNKSIQEVSKNLKPVNYFKPNNLIHLN